MKNFCIYCPISYNVKAALDIKTFYRGGNEGSEKLSEWVFYQVAKNQAWGSVLLGLFSVMLILVAVSLAGPALRHS